MFTSFPIVAPTPIVAVFDTLAIITLSVALVLWLRMVWRRSQNAALVGVHALFGVYLIVLAAIVFLPWHGISSAAAGYQGTQPLRRAWQWGTRLHWPWTGGNLQTGLGQATVNALLLVPFGFGVGFCAPRLKTVHRFAVCAVMTIALELTQLGISVVLGITYRTFDVNDIVDNIFGATVGIGLFVLFAWFAGQRALGRARPIDTLPGLLAHTVALHRFHRVRALPPARGYGTVSDATRQSTSEQKRGQFR